MGVCCMKIKRDNTDKWFSDAVRLAADYTCQATGKHSPPPFDNGAMDCAHNISRRHRATRWHPKNAVCLSRAEHMAQTDDPYRHVEFMRQYFGEDCQLMRELANSMFKITKKDEAEIVKHYKNEIKRIQKLRGEGVLGVIELEIPEVLL